MRLARKGERGFITWILDLRGAEGRPAVLLWVWWLGWTFFFTKLNLAQRAGVRLFHRFRATFTLHLACLVIAAAIIFTCIAWTALFPLLLTVLVRLRGVRYSIRAREGSLVVDSVSSFRLDCLIVLGKVRLKSNLLYWALNLASDDAYHRYRYH